jgi:uncharacterized protein YbjT (DUF2867 family)
MNALIFGATGMVGQGLLRECLADRRVEKVITIGRTPAPQTHEKLVQIVHENLFDISALAPQLSDIDACFFTLGVTSSGLSEPEYTLMTYQLTHAIAKVLSPNITFIYVSGAGTDSSEQGKTMWARVKGRTENMLLRTFKSACMFRPGLIQPMHGIKSKTKAYRVFYAIAWPVMPLVVKLFPKHATTTERIARAMINAAVNGAPKRILETADINALAT